ncbi:MAG: hypothetical protein WA843_04075 [Candidatus Saccharimonadales bacterium]
MKRSKHLKVLLRALFVIAATVIVVSGVTFAALQSQQIKLTGNTIETATANLQISPDGTNFSTAQTGFDFNNIVPGGGPGPQSSSIFLKNAGGTTLSLKLAVSSTPVNPNNLDLSKVTVILTPTTGNNGPQSFSLQSLITSNATGGVAITSPAILTPGSKTQFTLQISMTADAVTGPSASLGNIDFAFSGVL